MVLLQNILPSFQIMAMFHSYPLPEHNPSQKGLAWNVRPSPPRNQPFAYLLKSLNSLCTLGMIVPSKAGNWVTSWVGSPPLNFQAGLWWEGVSLLFSCRGFLGHQGHKAVSCYSVKCGAISISYVRRDPWLSQHANHIVRLWMTVIRVAQCSGQWQGKAGKLLESSICSEPDLWVNKGSLDNGINCFVLTSNTRRGMCSVSVCGGRILSLREAALIASTQTLFCLRKVGWFRLQGSAHLLWLNSVCNSK